MLSMRFHTRRQHQAMAGSAAQQENRWRSYTAILLDQRS
jgi:hypothetical protein